MMESYRFGDYDEAIKMLQELKRQGKKNKQMVFTIDFDNDTESRKTITPEEGCILVRKSKTIIINEDVFIPHMQLFSTVQTDIKNLRKEGIMHDIIFGHKLNNKQIQNVCSKK